MAGKRSAAAVRKAGKAPVKRITSKQRAARKVNIKVARAAKKKSGGTMSAEKARAIYEKGLAKGPTKKVKIVKGPNVSKDVVPNPAYKLTVSRVKKYEKKYASMSSKQRATSLGKNVGSDYKKYSRGHRKQLLFEKWATDESRAMSRPYRK